MDKLIECLKWVWNHVFKIFQNSRKYLKSEDAALIYITGEWKEWERTKAFEIIDKLHDLKQYLEMLGYNSKLTPWYAKIEEAYKYGLESFNNAKK